MKNISVNFNETVGKIKPMHAVNNAPIHTYSNAYFHYLGEAKFPFSRLHDTGGVYGGGRFVDIENIFRDFSADENLPESYDFAFTDWLMEEAFIKYGVEPFFRLGTTIENGQNIKAYRIFPPADHAKWARICEHIVAHYNEGWADGYKMGIRYWEIWCEPDNYPDIEDNCLWKGTFQEYIDLYKTTARHLKARFGDTIKVGGYSSCGFYALLDGYNAEAHSSSRTDYFIDCFFEFLEALKKDPAPLDFFSWHSYSGVAANCTYTRYAREKLDEYGFKETENILNEYNPGTAHRGTLRDSANIAAHFLALQHEPLDMLMYYDGQIHGSYQGLYNPINYTPFKAFYVFCAFSDLYELGTSVKIGELPEEFYCVGAKNDAGDIAVMITNRNEDDTLSVKLEGVKKSEYEIWRVNEEKSFELCETVSDLSGIKIAQYETIVIK